MITIIFYNIVIIKGTFSQNYNFNTNLLIFKNKKLKITSISDNMNKFYKKITLIIYNNIVIRMCGMQFLIYTFLLINTI
ncbi:hypothetical protein EAE91_18040 [Photorhabdus noenieputensis]|nr:hypothetical protein [Photorhabdus noenieputensis]PQQ23327.1 hypothetical protein C6H64_22815 [Photorhabdus luminescens]